MEELREAHGKMEMRTLQILRTVETASRRRDVAVREEYTIALRKASEEIQAKLWGDLARLKVEHERQIHTELRTIRRKFAASGGEPIETTSVTTAVASAPPPPAPPFDYASFEERFRGDEESVSLSQSFYLPYFADLPRVVDLGCGRGEFLAGLRDRGADVLGVDLDATALAACREKNIGVERADIFEFLARQQDNSWDGVMCAHVIEHLPPLRLQELTDLCWRKLRSGGVVAFETPNPACLAIFAGDFYLDPTHRAPVPFARMHFHLRESGFMGIEITERHPAPEVFPELNALDQLPQTAAFRRSFSGLDYAIIARKWRVMGLQANASSGNRPRPVQEHLARYRFAETLASGRRVLDAGCGAGYGTALLAQRAESACGVDLPRDPRLGQPNPAESPFAQPTVRLPFRDACFDLCPPSVIEHLPDWKGFLKAPRAHRQRSTAGLDAQPRLLPRIAGRAEPLPRARVRLRRVPARTRSRVSARDDVP
jgi:2-polyprenyl-3-methyl-5-hydroxy-6-metoxy-1,4-benzoquinol methylase